MIDTAGNLEGLPVALYQGLTEVYHESINSNTRATA